jgi:hypothetical protein
LRRVCPLTIGSESCGVGVHSCRLSQTGGSFVKHLAYAEVADVLQNYLITMLFVGV